MKKFEKLYNRVIGENIKQFNSAVNDLSVDKLKKEKESQIKMDKFKSAVKKINGVTRRGKCARDLHDKIIQDRDNAVQTTAVEVEESKNILDTSKMKKAVNAMKSDKKLNIKDTEIPSPLEIEQFSIDNKLHLTQDEITYIQQEWDKITDEKI